MASIGSTRRPGASQCQESYICSCASAGTAEVLGLSPGFGDTVPELHPVQQVDFS